jgi:NADH-quinone oxidoreductase subunit E
VNAIAEKYAEEIAKILEKYPPEQKRSAVMALLYLAQREDGYTNKQNIQDIAEILEITPTEVTSLVGFYTLYHDQSNSATDWESRSAKPPLTGWLPSKP